MNYYKCNKCNYWLVAYSDEMENETCIDCKKGLLKPKNQSVTK